MIKLSGHKITGVYDKYKDDRRISRAIVIQFCMLITNYAYKGILRIENPSSRAFISFIFMFVVGVFFMACIKVVLSRVGDIFIFTFGLGLVINIISVIVHRNDLHYLGEIYFYLFFICLPNFIYYFAIYNKRFLLKMLVQSSYYQISLAIILFVTSYVTTGIYDMVFSYLTLTPVLLLIYKLNIKFKWYDFILIIAGIMMIVAVGSRGPLMSIITYVLILNISDERNKKIKKYGKIILTFTIFTILIIYVEKLVFAVNKLLLEYGINSRTLVFFMSRGADFSSGRIPIYFYSAEKIQLQPFIGYGIGGDRVLLGGTYPHNIFLEILLNFGVLIGGFLIFAILFYWSIALFRSRNETEKDLAVLFFSLGAVPCSFLALI